jgi:WD40 repeat protein
MKSCSKFLHALVLLSACSFVTAQKKDPIYLGIDGENKRGVITYKNGDAFILSLPDLSVIKKLSPTTPEDNALHSQLSPDGKKLAIFHDKSKKIALWDIESGAMQIEIPAKLPAQKGRMQIFEFDPTRNHLICRVAEKGSTPTFSVYDLTTGNEVGALPKMNNTFPIDKLAISPDGKKLLTFGNSTSMERADGGLEIFDYQTGEKLGEKQLLSTGVRVVSARFIGNDSVEVKNFDQNGGIGESQSRTRFAVSDKESRLILKNWTGKELEYDGRNKRFVVKDQVELTTTEHLLGRTAFAPSPGWLLVMTKKPDMLTLYSTANTEDKSARGLNWKEPAQLTTVVLP